MEAAKIQEQLESNRRSVAFDSYDITVRQLFDMVSESLIDVTPEYQRHFIWDETRQSNLIESIFLGIPVPSLFMATNKDSTWEVIDGLQRLTTIVNFVGDDNTIKRVNPKCQKLELEGLDRLSTINGLKFESLPKSLQLLFQTRPIRITVLNDRSDYNTRYDLFERLNTGGVILHPQEIRNCVYLGEFNDFLKKCAENTDFLSVIKLTKNAERTGNIEELVLKFFAYYEDRSLFQHSVKEFLNDYMSKKTKSFKNEKELRKIFEKTFANLNKALPKGVVRGTRTNVTPLVLYEAIAVGAADAINSGKSLNSSKLIKLLDDINLNKLTTGATNSKTKLAQRINYVSERAT
ncbi:DUF262 domain-containing protein [Hymenobacter sp. BRD67]|uniref:DUF262 domain-containing protein n=1 Tax=Hymenobacter sp. BRD67 TaxID=2675877 RepID=UPI0015640112|nr:DUF262 domain-containing protein [Hymenobacter sp. BRD67]QKG54624.1 DUF262 domain-containing protein [Hymenobacter sp. BRD67]